MAKNNNLTDFLTGVADAIRTKKGTSALIDPQDFESEIASIPSGGSEDFGDIKTPDSIYQGSYANSFTSMPSFKIDDNRLLFSGTTTNNLNVGIWLYDKTTNTYTQLSSDGKGFSKFVQIGNLVFIYTGTSSSYSYGLYVFNIQNSTLTALYTSGYSFGGFHDVGDGYLIYSVNKVFHYNTSTNTVDVEYTNNKTWNTSIQIGNDVLVSGSGTNAGIVLYNSSDGTITQIYSNSAGWSFTLRGNRCICGSTTSGSGVVVYNTETKTIAQLYNSGNRWGYVSNENGVTKNDLVRVSEIINNKIVIVGYQGATGILLYDLTNETITQIYSNGDSWCLCHRTGTEFFVSSQSSSYPNFYKLDISDNSFTRIGTYASYGAFKSIKLANDKILLAKISGNQSSILYVYSGGTATKALTGFIGTGSELGVGQFSICFVEIQDGYIISSTVSSSSAYGNNLMFFNTTTNQGSSIYKGPWAYKKDIATPTENGYILTSSSSAMKFIFSNTTKTITDVYVHIV